MKGCRPLTDAEKAQVLESVDGRFQLRDRLLVTFGVYAGFRISEILSLTVEDVFQNGVIPNHVTVKRRNLKGKREGRTIVIHEAIKEALIAYLLSRPNLTPASPLFLNQAGTKAISRQQAWNIVEAAFTACGLTGTLGTHSLRKTFAASVYKRSGHCLLKTKKALGHTDIRTTEKYLSFTDEEVEDLIATA